MTGALAEFERECFARLRERYDDLSWDTEVEMHWDAVKSWYDDDMLVGFYAKDTVHMAIDNRVWQAMRRKPR